ncbi:hypothetical protein KFU94_41260 [Chloroflexi bacterium TSY]|nr:hypothetical protein [Chloroflexi bacterium TSY]
MSWVMRKASTSTSSALTCMACHYIPYHSENWVRDWSLISFDGTHKIHYMPRSA